MQVDFYQLAGTPIEKTVPPIAAKTLESGERLLIVADAAELRSRLDLELWTFSPTSFVPHGDASGNAPELQPVLISDSATASNGAKFVLIADGKWREDALAFDRVFYLFGDDRIDEARTAWRALAQKEGVEPRYWKQDGGRWRQGP